MKYVKKNAPKTLWSLCLIICFTVVFPFGTYADEEQTSQKETMQVMMDEINDLKEKVLGEEGEKLHFGGYADFHYNGTTQQGKKNKMDFHRLAIGFTYRFTDWIIFEAEIDFEHGGQEIELEFANVNLQFYDPLNASIGALLMPVGFLNQHHEPILYYSVERPYVDKYVIPTTWTEGGLGIYGSYDSVLRYQLYMVGGLNAEKFTASSGIRKGRGGAANAFAEDFAGVARVAYSGVPGLHLGVSGYFGGASQGVPGLSGVTVGIVEGDARYRWKQFELRGVVASNFISDTEKIFAETGQAVGKTIFGWYVEADCHAGEWFLPGGMDLVFFGRYEQFDTQESMAPGLTADPVNDRHVTTFGMAYYPIPRLAFKVDGEYWKNGADEDWFHYGVGFGLVF